MIKLLAPVDKAEEAEELIRAGADELYCGVLWREWLLKYPVAALNRRPSPIANLKSFDELKKCVEIAHSYGVSVNLTINEHYYTAEQYPLLLKFIEKALDTGVDAFIVSDLGLLLTLNEMSVGVKIHVSTGGVAFNSEAVNFYRELGVSRVQLPRHLTLGEIGEICRETSDVELGVFILNSKCANIDGFCTFMHFSSQDPMFHNACMLLYQVYVESAENDEKKIVAGVRQKVWERFHIDDRPCGACALYEFNEFGLDYVKIVGRGYPTLKKIVDIKFIRMLLDLLKNNPSREEFRKVTRQLYSRIYGRPCRVIMCYYPEVMKNGEGNLHNETL
jgi:putative protease